MKDRRARLRPRDGARNLYYGGPGVVQASDNNLFKGELGGSPWVLGEQDGLPWQANKMFSEQAPNSPNIIKQDITISDTNLTGDFGPRDASNIANRALENSLNKMSGNSGGSFGRGKGKISLNERFNILEPLAQTDGLIWPYTPTISFTQGVEYNSYNPVHTNQEFYAYARTSAPQIMVTGNMAVQNESEAAYALAQIHFLRVISKMSFGQGSQNPGTPPPVLLFSAYGEYMFNDLPVILQAFNLDFTDDVDYIKVPNTETYVPSLFVLNTTLLVQNTPSKLRSFNMEKFRSGELLKKKGWL